MVADKMSKKESTDNNGSPFKVSATPVPGSPSPMRGKRPQVSQSHDGRIPLRKKLKYERELTLHILLPNGTAFKFKADAARIHSLEALLDLVKKNSLERQLESTPALATSEPVQWANVKLEDHCGNVIKKETLITIMTEAEVGSTMILLIQDGRKEPVHISSEMFDITPKAEMLEALPQGYTLETALADQVDNALQAVWHNDKNSRRLVSVHLSRDEITIFDTGQGMEASGDNSIEFWGTVGGSTHREIHHKALGGKPPFLKPYFGKYGAGAVAAAVHLGGCVTVWSKTRRSGNVARLVLRTDELLQRRLEDPNQRVWNAPGGLRQMSKDERQMSPHGSFTKVVITKLKQQYCLSENEQHYWDVSNVRQLLKEIYFPYIQTEDESKTIFPVEIEVNEVNLTEVLECETAISKLHTCNGEPFVFDIHLILENGDERDNVRGKLTKTRVLEAKARITCQYYPNLKGKEALEAVAEEINRLKPSNSMTFENMNRVTIRWLGRLLPEVKWPVFPFMEVPPKREHRSGPRVWAKRVRAFVDTDAAFYPVPSKTELAPNQPFVVALRLIGSESFDNTPASEVKASIIRNDKELKPSQLADAYLKWLIEMHTNFDEEFVFADADDAKFIFNHKNCLKDLGVGNCVIVYKHMKASKQEWQIQDDNPLYVKLPKGPGLKADKYVTLEYFFHDAGEDDRGVQVKFLCRGIEVDASEGCQITSLSDGNLVFKLKRSEWFPATLLNTAKNKESTETLLHSISMANVISWNALLFPFLKSGTQCLDDSAWKKKKEEVLNKLPGFVEVLKEEDSKKFEYLGAFPINKSRFQAGFPLPKDFLVVVRPRKGSGVTFKQGMIFGEGMKINLEVQHCSCPNGIVCRKGRAIRGKEVSSKVAPVSQTDDDDHRRVVCNLKAKSSTKNGVKGLYVFSTEATEINRLVTQGTYTFLFTLESDKYEDVRAAVSSIEISPSAITAMWTFCNHPDPCTITQHENTKDDTKPLIRLNETIKQDLYVQKYDQYGNRQDFKSSMELEIIGVTLEGESLAMHTKVQSSVVAGNQEGQRLLLKNILFESGSLTALGSTQEALLRVCLAEEQQADIECKVLPGALTNLEMISSDPPIIMESMWFLDYLQPGQIIRDLKLQGLDAFKNKIEKGQKLLVELEGVEFQDNCGNDRVADEHGTLQLGGLLKVTCHYNSSGSIAFHSGTRLISTIYFETVRRRLVADKVSKEAYVGRQLKGISIKIVDEDGIEDESVHGYNQSITVDWLHGVTYPFVKGECILPSLQMPEKPGTWKGTVSFSADPSLSVTLTVELKLNTAATLGPANEKKMTAECGVPFSFPFKVYDDQHKPALLADSLKESIKVRFEGRDTGNDSETTFRSSPVDCKDVNMSMVDGIPTYEAQIVVSMPAGSYVITLEDTSLTLAGKAESLCQLQHGSIAQLVVVRSDGTILQPYEESDAGSVSIIEAKRRGPIPDLDVKLLDSVGNVCSGCEGRTVRVRLLEFHEWTAPVTEISRGIGKLKCPALEVPVGLYQVLIELDSSPEELYSLEEQTRPVQSQLSLRVNPGNYPAYLRLLYPNQTLPVSLTNEPTQYVPSLSVVIESADGLRLQSRPTVGVKLHGDRFLASGPKEYFGKLVQSDDNPNPGRYEFTQICAPSQAGLYSMEFFVSDSDVPSQSRFLRVFHGPPNKIMITPRTPAQEINVLKVNIVDVHGNLCENHRADLQLSLELTLSDTFTVTPSLYPCTVASKRTTEVEKGNGDFGVLEVNQGSPGLYSLAVVSETLPSLIPGEARVFVIRGKPNQDLLQLCDQYRACQVNEGCGRRIAKCKKELQLTKAELRSFENQKKNLEVHLTTQERRRIELAELRLKCHDAEVLDKMTNQPKRDHRSVMQDLTHLAQNKNTAPLAFWEACLERRTFSPEQLDEFVGLVAMLAWIEDDSLNRILAEYLGTSSLSLIITRTQRGIDSLAVYDAHGQLDESRGLHGFARSRNYSISGRYEALALTDTRPYNPMMRPAVDTEHHQRTLCIDPPRLPHSNQIPEGFLGYAVNLVYLNPQHLQMRVNTKTQRNVGLRESLWFHLLKLLQVYDTRRNMNSAKEQLEKFDGGAVSLDGGLIKANGRQQLGERRRNVPICFGLVPCEERRRLGSLMPVECMSIERQKESIETDKRIASAKEDLSSLIPKMEQTIVQLDDLKRKLNQDEKQEREAQKSSKVIQDQIAELQRAAQRATRNGDITGNDKSGDQGSDSEKMRTFMM